MFNIINKIILRFININKYYVNKLRQKLTYYNINVYPNIYRPSSKPYISGDTFRKNANHIFDETKVLNPQNIRNNDIVFLKSDLIDLFFNDFHKDIKSKYILLTHNSDLIIDEKYKHLNDEKIIHWFSQNLNFPNNDDFSLLPIGLENKRYLNAGILSHFNNYTKEEKTQFILGSFNRETNVDREKLWLIIKNNLLIDKKNFNNHKDYVKNMSKYRFNLCPRGNGTDTHRFWESLMVGTYPIVVRNPFTNNLERMGIPGLYLNNWSELDNLTEEKLESIYLNLNKNKDSSKFATFSYWKNQIDSKRQF